MLDQAVKLPRKQMKNNTLVTFDSVYDDYLVRKNLTQKKLIDKMCNELFVKKN